MSCTAGLAQVSNPPNAPHQILVFPQRDFVSANGYAATDRVIVRVTHPGGATFESDANIVPQDDAKTAAFDGIVEVNHPGGACWVGNTPNIRPGDKVSIIVNGVPGADETTVAKVAGRLATNPSPGRIEIHGTAADANGNPIPIDQLEQRLVVPKDLFVINGRRTLRATKATGEDGTLDYDAPGSTSWTATYTNLPDADVTRALGAESRIMWLGSNPAAAVEGTFFEVGAGIAKGPGAPCTAPAELVTSSVATPSTPTLSQAPSQKSLGATDITLTLPAPAPGVITYGVYRNGVAAGSVDVTGPLTFSDLAMRTPGSFQYTIDATDSAGDRSAMSAAANVTIASPNTTVEYKSPPVAPHSIIAFPSRDFVSASGYAPDDQVNVYVYRPNASGSSSNLVGYAVGQIPQDGLVEINHPGGGCWAGVTPRISPRDIIRTVIYGANGSVRAEDTTVADIAAGRPTNPAPGAIRISGTAAVAGGGPIDLAQLEERLVARNDAFLANNRRTLRAGAGLDGTLAYTTTTGNAWIATYTGLAQVDVDRAMNTAESRIQWLGKDPAAGTELTIFENADGVVPGPSSPCTAPAGTLAATPSDTGTTNLSAPTPANTSAPGSTTPPPPPPPGPGSVTLSFNANQIKFGTVDRNRTQDQTITIKNSGTASAALNAASFALPATQSAPSVGYSFVTNQSTCFTATVAPNKTCNVIVRFAAPAGSAAAVTFNGTLSVTAANAAPKTVTTALTATTK